jgi:hypothetical protein
MTSRQKLLSPIPIFSSLFILISFVKILLRRNRLHPAKRQIVFRTVSGRRALSLIIYESSTDFHKPGFSLEHSQEISFSSFSASATFSANSAGASFSSLMQIAMLEARHSSEMVWVILASNSRKVCQAFAGCLM